MVADGWCWTCGGHIGARRAVPPDSRTLRGRELEDEAESGKSGVIDPPDSAGPKTAGLPPASAGQQLSGRQRALLDAFSQIDPRLAEMFRGAPTVLEHRANGE